MITPTLLSVLALLVISSKETKLFWLDPVPPTSCRIPVRLSS